MIVVYWEFFYGIMVWVIWFDNEKLVVVKVIDKGLYKCGWVVDFLWVVVEWIGLI